MNSISNILDQFNPITLEEMDRVKLMNRTDTKYIFPSAVLLDIFSRALDNYLVLVADNSREAIYNTLYYDTVKDDMFLLHHNGKRNRYKIRQRQYVHSGLTFIEIKHKTNKGRTIKKRIQRNKFKPELPEKALPFIAKYLPFKAGDLVPRMHTRFTRATLVHKTDKERVTVDYNLEFDDTNGHIATVPYMAIAEVKQDGFSNNSDFIAILNTYRIKPSGMSKYCIGSLMVRKGLKHNRFKEKLLTINKMNDER